MSSGYPMSAALAALALAELAYAGAALEVQPVDPSLRQVSVLGPGDSRFSGLVANLSSSNASTGLEAFLPYSVVLTNTGSDPILGVVVRFAMTFPDGRNTQYVHFYENGFLRPILSPSDQLVSALDRSVFEAARRGRPLPNDYVSPAAKATRVVASIDGVVFGDGTFRGADKGNSFARKIAVLKAESDLCLGILQFQNSDPALGAYLQQRSKLQPASRDPFVGDFYTDRLATEAASLYRVYQREGGTAVAQFCKEHQGIVQKQIALLHK